MKIKQYSLKNKAFFLKLINKRNISRYTIEFGSIKEDGKIKAYGGGIAGSFGECNVKN